MAFQPQFRLVPRIQRQIKAIDRTAGFLEAVRLRPEWVQQVRARAEVREALASVQIEGSSLTLEEAFDLAERLPRRELRPSEREFCNYLRAFEAIEGLRGKRDEVITRGDVLNLHGLLLDGVRGGNRFVGELRREDVKVGDITDGGVVIHHDPPTWSRVEPALDELLAWIEVSKEKGDGEDDRWVHPVVQAAIVHHRLVWIHPFVDGNGRAARMLTALLLYQRGYDFKYLFRLSTYYNENRDDYYKALRSADSGEDYTEWLVFFLGGLSYQMVDIQEQARAGEAEST